MEGRKKRGREDRQTNGSHRAPSCANTKQEVPRVDEAHPGGQPPQGNEIAPHHKCLPASQALPPCRSASSNYPRGAASGPASTGTGICDIHLGSRVRGWLWAMKNHCALCFLFLSDWPLTRTPKPGPAYTFVSTNTTHYFRFLFYLPNVLL